MIIRKAQVVEKINSKYKIRVPIYHGIEGSANFVVDKDLPLATVSTFTQIIHPFVVGDIVYVLFENNDHSNPIIIGILNNEDRARSPKDNTIINKIEVIGGAQLPSHTTIGQVTNTQIQYLSNVYADIQGQLDTKQTIFQYINEYVEEDIFEVGGFEEIYLVLKEDDYQVDSKVYNIGVGTKFKIGSDVNNMLLEIGQPVVVNGNVTSVLVYGRR